MMEQIFGGWQKQKDKLNIQGSIERAIEVVSGGEKVDLIASGRTDAGVHALEQVANFKSDIKIPIEKLPFALNANLRKSIRIKNAEIVSDDFNSRFNAKKKTYRYVINDSKQGSAIYRTLEYHFSIKLDEKKMDEAAKYLIGTHDFKSFKASGRKYKNKHKNNI